MKFKIAFIGAGSLIFTRTLFTDIMSVPEFRDIDIAFTDISEDNLKKVRLMPKGSGGKWDCNKDSVYPGPQRGLSGCQIYH